MGEAKRRKQLGFGSKKSNFSVRLMPSNESLDDWQTHLLVLDSFEKPHLQKTNRLSPCEIIKNGQKIKGFALFSVQTYQGGPKLYAQFILPDEGNFRLTQREVNTLSKMLCKERMNDLQIVIKGPESTSFIFKDPGESRQEAGKRIAQAMRGCDNT